MRVWCPARKKFNALVLRVARGFDIANCDIKSKVWRSVYEALSVRFLEIDAALVDGRSWPVSDRVIGSPTGRHRHGVRALSDWYLTTCNSRHRTRCFQRA